MVSCFLPRGRFLIKANGNLRQTHSKHQKLPTQDRWYVLKQLRRTFLTRGGSTGMGNGKNDLTAAECETKNNVDNLIRRTAFSKTANNETATHLKRKNLNEDYEERLRRSIWLRWTGFLLRWAPVGFCVFGAIEWHLNRKKCQSKNIPHTASEFESKVYCSLPLRLLSRCWGWLASIYVPTSLRPHIYGFYSKIFDVNMDEALYSDYKYYNSLSEFFTRPLRDDVRIIDGKAPLISPADGKVLHFGSATNSVIEQVKGVNYSVESFLGPPTWIKTKTTIPANKTVENNNNNINFNNNNNNYIEEIKENRNKDATTLYQCVIYLAPGDYHRFHSPTDWQPQVRRHFAGELLSVSPKIASWLPGLFCLNERVLYLGKWQHGFFSYTAVGATNVGSVQIYMDEKLKTNRWVGLNVGSYKKRETFDELPLNMNDDALKKGDLIGQFNMGSTIVLLFEAPKDFVFTLEPGQKIRVGQSLGYFRKNVK